MQRVNIRFPGMVHFTTELEILIGHINYGKHLGNDAVLSLVHEARIRFLDHLGYTEFDLEGVSLIMADAAIRFRSEAFHGEVMLLELSVGELSTVGFDLYYNMKNKSTGEVVAEVKTGMICFDYDSKKISRLPGAFINRFSTT